MDNTQKILKGIMGLLVVVLIGLIYVSFTVPKVEIMYVTTVSYSEALGTTSVWSYDHYIIFQGIHEGIDPGTTYKFTYMGSLPWSKLLSVDTHEIYSRINRKKTCGYEH